MDLFSKLVWYENMRGQKNKKSFGVIISSYFLFDKIPILTFYLIQFRSCDESEKPSSSDDPPSLDSLCSRPLYLSFQVVWNTGYPWKALIELIVSYDQMNIFVAVCLLPCTSFKPGGGLDEGSDGGVWLYTLVPVA